MIVTKTGIPLDQDGQVDNEPIRKWARQNGFEISQYGPVPWEAYKAFVAAHKEKVDKASDVTVRFI